MNRPADHRFRLSELDITGRRPVPGEEPDALLAVARELEAVAGNAPPPGHGFTDRVMAAVAREPLPRPARALVGALRRASPRAAIAGIVDAWSVALSGGRPFAIRAQALAVVLVVAAVVSSAGGLAAVGAFGLLSPGPSQAPSVPEPSVVLPATTSPAPSAPPSMGPPRPSAEPSEQAEPTGSPEVSEEPNGTEEPDGSHEPDETSTPAGTPRPTTTPAASSTPEPTETATPTASDTPEPTDTPTPSASDTPEPTASDTPDPSDGSHSGSGSSG